MERISKPLTGPDRPGEGSATPGAETFHGQGAVVRRLHRVVEEYLEGGVPMGLEPLPGEISFVLDLAISEARGKPLLGPLDDSAHEHFLHGLYEELVQQPSNIFETTIYPDGREFARPLTPEEWIACLERLRAELAEDPGQEDPPPLEPSKV